MKVVFMGTPDFSVPVLKGLMESEEHDSGSDPAGQSKRP